MAIEHSRPNLSYDDYAAIDGDERYELIEGELVPMGPAPFLRHQRIAFNIALALRAYAEASGRGETFIAPVDVVLRADGPGTVLQPDVVFISSEHRERLTPANIQGPPDLVVEVLSPSNARKDAVRKRLLYERFGVPEYWIVPEAVDRIEVLRLAADGRYGKPVLYEPGEKLTSNLLPGLGIDVASLFPLEGED